MLSRQELLSFSTMSSINILGLTVMLNKTSPTAEWVLPSYCYTVRLYMDFYSTSIPNINKSEYGPELEFTIPVITKKALMTRLY